MENSTGEERYGTTNTYFLKCVQTMKRLTPLPSELEIIQTITNHIPPSIKRVIIGTRPQLISEMTILLKDL